MAPYPARVQADACLDRLPYARTCPSAPRLTCPPGRIPFLGPCVNRVEARVLE